MLVFSQVFTSKVIYWMWGWILVLHASLKAAYWQYPLKAATLKCTPKRGLFQSLGSTPKPPSPWLRRGLTCAGDRDKADDSDEEQCLEAPGGWMHSARFSKLKAQSSKLRRGTETATKQTGTCLLWLSGVCLLTLLQQSVWGLKKKSTTRKQLIFFAV